LTRVIAAYKKAREDQKHAAPAFQVGNEWVPIYERDLSEIMEALSSGEISRVARHYRNFFRDKCSSGLVGLPLDMNKHYFTGKSGLIYRHLYMADCIHRFRYWRSMLGEQFPVDVLQGPSIGNPFGYYYEGKFINTGSDYQHYYATKIGQLSRSHHPVCVEIGAGYGGMAYFLLRDNPRMGYVDFDLPENLALTSYYLMSSLPQREFCLYGENEGAGPSAERSTVFLMPNFEMPRWPSASADLVFNSYSLAEMTRETIATYVAEMSRITSHYLFHVNHTRNSKVVADDFGIDPRRFMLLYKMPAGWNRGRALNSDEWEYLYEKREMANGRP
jgi:hypothetical protein